MQKANEQTPQVPRATVNNNRKMPGEFRIRGVRSHIQNALENIADHLGIPVNDLMKRELPEIIKRYPEHMHQPRGQA